MAHRDRVDIITVLTSARYAGLRKLGEVRDRDPRKPRDRQYLLESKIKGWKRDDGMVCAGFTPRFDALSFVEPKEVANA